MSKKNVLIVISAVIALVAVIGLIVFHGSTNATTPGNQILADRALNVIDSLEAGNYQQATRDFSSRAVPLFSQKFPAMWPAVTAKAGKLKARALARVEGNTVYITCTYENGDLWAKVEFDSTNQITNFSMYGHPV